MAVEAKGLREPYATEFSNGRFAAQADTTADKGGREAGFRPHELLEASLATCVSMTARIVADERGIPLEFATTRVALDRSGEDETVFEYSVELHGDLSDSQRTELLDEVSRRSSVRRTLSKRISFKPV